MKLSTASKKVISLTLVFAFSISNSIAYSDLATFPSSHHHNSNTLAASFAANRPNGVRSFQQLRAELSQSGEELGATGLPFENSERSELRYVDSQKLRLAIAQINVTVGDLDGNYKKIVDYIERARNQGTDLVVFPELILTGYPPEDLVHKKHFIDYQRSLLISLLDHTQNITVVVGFIDQDKNGNIYNAATIISNGELKGIYHKNDLPNYGVFDEKRYFKAGKGNQLFDIHGNLIGNKVFHLNGVSLCVNVCEDVWNEGEVVLEQADAGARLLINTSASPFYAGKLDVRHELLKKRASQTGAYLVYANLVGGQDEVVFDGGGFIISPDGEVVSQGNLFEEGLITKDLDFGSATTVVKDSKNIIHLRRALSQKEQPEIPKTSYKKLDRLAQIYESLVLAVRDYVRKNGFKKVVIGLSGGIDSALVAAIAVDALGKENVLGISMSSRHSSDDTKSDAKKFAESLGIEFKEIPIEDVFKATLTSLNGDSEFSGKPVGVTEENLQARIRGMFLMGFSNKLGHMVLSTGNKSESAVGYATLYGDMAGGFSPIKDVYKTDVFELSRYRNRLAGRELILESIINRPPSAELSDNQKDTDSLPPYDILDGILEAYIEHDASIDEMAKKWARATVERVVKMVDQNEYKRRQSAPGIKTTTTALGKDRRMPITTYWDEKRIDEFVHATAAPKRIGILGGTFNPVHNAHIKLAEAAQAELKLDRVIFVPTNVTPDRVTERLASPEDRYEMTRLATADNPRFQVSDFEISHDGPSYSVDTIRHILAQYPPGTEIFFIIGADRVDTLDQWKGIGEIRKLAKFAVAGRPGTEPVSKLPDGVVRLNYTGMSFSSTHLRRALAEMGSHAADELNIPAAVANYISANELYDSPKRSELRVETPEEYVTRLNQERPEGYPERNLENPPFYLSSNVVKNARTRGNPFGWAHRELDDPKLSPAERARLTEEIRTEIKRFSPRTPFVDGRPRNRKQTGLKGRGLLGRYGPNPAEDPVILRYNQAGELEVLVIEREDGGGLALPGGMVRFGEENKMGITATRELNEETNAEIDLTKGLVIYEGLADDWRDTDDAWIVTRGIAVVLTWEESQHLKLKASSDAKADSARFERIDSDLKFYARHKIIIDNAVAKVKSGHLMTREDQITKHFPSLSLTMKQLEKAYQAFREGKHKTTQTYDLVIPNAPHGGNYAVVAGIEEALAETRRRRFTPEIIQKLRQLEYFSEDFLKYLSNSIFEGDIDALQEGRVVASGLPIMRIKASPVELALLEDLIKNRVGFSTTIATKTARIKQAANGDFVTQEALEKLQRDEGIVSSLVKRIREVFDYGQRRAQGKSANVASRAAVIGGAYGTSNVKAAKQFFLEILGTMAHMLIQVFGPKREIDAFRAYAKVFPNSSVFLIDTYDVLQGARNAAKVAKEMEEKGNRLVGVRIDSGDLVILSKQVRKIFDDAGLQYVKIFVSDDLDEEKITELLSKGAMIDGFGVGTNLITGGKQAYLDLEFTPSTEERIWRIRHKGKITQYLKTPKGRMAHAQYHEEIDELLVPMWRSGERVFGVEKPWKAHERAVREMDFIAPQHKKLQNSEEIPVVKQDSPLSIDPETDGVLSVDTQTAFMRKGGLGVKGGDDIVPNARKTLDLFPKKNRFASIDKHPRGHISWASSFEGIQAMTYLTYDMAKDWTEENHQIAPHALFNLKELKEHLQKTGGQMLWPDHAGEGTFESEAHPDMLESEFGYVQIKGMNPVIDSYSAFFDNERNPTELVKEIKNRGIKRLFIFGLAFDYCVGWSAEDAKKLGFEVVVIEDATRAVGYPPTSVDNMKKSFQDNGIVLTDMKSFIDANSNVGVFPALSLPQPIAHPLMPVEDENTALEEDFYHLTMAQVLFDHNLHQEESVFDYFYRTAPYGKDHIIVSGIKFFLEDLKKFKFTDEDINYFRNLKRFSEPFLKYLQDFKFQGDIFGLPEGSVAFAREPILRVQGKLIEAMIIETLLLKKMNFNSLEATWSNHTRREKGDVRLLEDGMGGAQGMSHQEASYSAFVGGTNATTNLDAHNNFGIPLVWEGDEGERLGSDFITGGVKASLGGVFKLSVIGAENRIKLSANEIKTSLPGMKTIFIVRNSDGKIVRRFIGLEGEEIEVADGETISTPLVPLVAQGNVMVDPRDVFDVQAYRNDQEAEYQGIAQAELSPALSALQKQLIDETRQAIEANKFPTKLQAHKKLGSKTEILEQLINKAVPQAGAEAFLNSFNHLGDVEFEVAFADDLQANRSFVAIYVRQKENFKTGRGVPYSIFNHGRLYYYQIQNGEIKSIRLGDQEFIEVSDDRSGSLKAEFGIYRNTIYDATLDSGYLTVIDRKGIFRVFNAATGAILIEKSYSDQPELSRNPFYIDVEEGPARGTIVFLKYHLIPSDEGNIYVRNYFQDTIASYDWKSGEFIPANSNRSELRVKELTSEADVAKVLQDHFVSFLFVGFGKSLYKDVEALKREIDAIVAENNKKWNGKIKWLAVYNGDLSDESNPNIGFAMRYLHEKHKVPVLAIVSDALRDQVVASHVDYIYYHPNESDIDRRIIYAGTVDDQPVGATKVYLSKLFTENGLQGVYALGGGQIAKQELEYAHRLGIPIDFIPLEAVHPARIASDHMLESWVRFNAPHALNRAAWRTNDQPVEIREAGAWAPISKELEVSRRGVTVEIRLRNEKDRIGNPSNYSQTVQAIDPREGVNVRLGTNHYGYIYRLVKRSDDVWFYPNGVSSRAELRNESESWLEVANQDAYTKLTTPSQTPYVVIFDVHGTLLEPTWRLEFAKAYKKLTGKNDEEAARWVQENTVGVSDDRVIQKLSAASGQAIENARAAFNEAREHYRINNSTKVFPEVLLLIKALIAKEVPVAVISGSERSIVLKQFADVGLLELIDKRNILGRDDIETPSGESKAFRDYGIRKVASRYPGSKIIHFNDWLGGEKAVKELGGFLFGLPQEGAAEGLRDTNKNILVQAGVDFIMKDWANWRELLELLAIDETVQRTPRSELRAKVDVDLSEPIVWKKDDASSPKPLHLNKADLKNGIVIIEKAGKKTENVIVVLGSDIVDDKEKGDRGYSLGEVKQSNVEHLDHSTELMGLPRVLRWKHSQLVGQNPKPTDVQELRQLVEQKPPKDVVGTNVQNRIGSALNLRYWVGVRNTTIDSYNTDGRATISNQKLKYNGNIREVVLAPNFEEQKAPVANQVDQIIVQALPESIYRRLASQQKDFVLTLDDIEALGIDFAAERRSELRRETVNESVRIYPNEVAIKVSARSEFERELRLAQERPQVIRALKQFQRIFNQRSTSKRSFDIFPKTAQKKKPVLEAVQPEAKAGLRQSTREFFETARSQNFGATDGKNRVFNHLNQAQTDQQLETIGVILGNDLVTQGGAAALQLQQDLEARGFAAVAVAGLQSIRDQIRLGAYDAGIEIGKDDLVATPDQALQALQAKRGKITRIVFVGLEADRGLMEHLRTYFKDRQIILDDQIFDSLEGVFTKYEIRLTQAYRTAAELAIHA